MDIPVTFDYNGKTYQGHLSRVAGTGMLWFLYVDKRFWGQLSHMLHGWRFNNQKDDMLHLSEYFGAIVSAWEDSHPQE